jgi:tRNA(Ile)-lysidine synthase
MTTPSALPLRVDRRLEGTELAGRRVVVGLSGGIDSVVLLDILHRLVASRRFTLGAIHVHHGLSPNADSWTDFCTTLCGVREIPLHVERVQVRRCSGQGIEAEARKARYAAYRVLDADYVALAHNLDDQAETVLLQLLRGAGPDGLAGMPFERLLGRGRLIRPLLDVPRSDIEAWARERGLGWIEDESNGDPAYARNHLRLNVLPLLEGHYPGYREALARTARNAADAAALADTVAVADLADLASEEGVEIAGLMALGPLRAANALRRWLRDDGVAMPPRVRLDEALRQLADAAPDASPEVVIGSHALRRYRERVRLAPIGGDEPWSVRWCGQPRVPLADGRVVVVHGGVGKGIARDRLIGHDVLLRTRQGGERFQMGANRPRRELKKLFQEHGVAPWERNRLPLLCVDGHVVWVPGLGIDPGWAAGEGEASLQFELARA